MTKTKNVSSSVEARRRRNEALHNGEVFPTHGSRSTYINYGCRCGECRFANTEYCSKRDRAVRARVKLWDG